MKIDLASIERLNDGNYTHWRKMVTLVMRMHGLLELVEGREQRPVEPFDENTKTKWAKDAEAWDLRDCQAQAILYALIGSDDHVYVDLIDTAAGVWTKIETLHVKTDPSSKIEAQGAYFGYAYDGTVSIARHVAQVELLAKRLRATGEQVSDEAVIAKVLDGLPREYDAVRTSFLFGAKAERTLDNLTAALVREESRKAKASDQSMALAVAKRLGGGRRVLSKTDGGRDDERRDRRERRPKCYACDELGHYARDCPRASSGRKSEESSSDEDGKCGQKRRTKCRNCGGRGHEASVCPSPAAVDDMDERSGERPEAFVAEVIDSEVGSWLAESGATDHETATLREEVRQLRDALEASNAKVEELQRVVADRKLCDQRSEANGAMLFETVGATRTEANSAICLELVGARRIRRKLRKARTVRSVSDKVGRIDGESDGVPEVGDPSTREKSRSFAEWCARRATDWKSRWRDKSELTDQLVGMA